MAYDIGPKIGIDGEAEFRRELQSINTGIRTLGSEMKAVTSEFIGNERSVEALTAKNDVLERTVLSLTERLDMQKKMLAEAAAAFGEADERTQKWQQVVNATTAELNTANAQIRQNTEAIAELNEGQDDAADSGSKLDEILGAAGISTSAFTAAGAIGLASKAIKEMADFAKDAVMESAAYADNVLTLSTNFGVATDKIQEYLYMSELADTSIDTITGSISKLTKNMDAARGGTGDAADAFRLLGIRVTDSNGQLRDSEEMFNEAIDRLGYIQNATERDALAMTLFGKSAMSLNSLIAAGSDGMAGYAQEAHNLGYVLTDEQLAVLGQVDDQFQRLDKTTEAIKNQLALEFAPEIIDLTQQLLDFAQAADWSAIGKGITDTTKVVVPALISMAQPMITLIEYSAKLVEAVDSAATAIGKLFGKNTDTSMVAATVGRNTAVSLSNPTPASLAASAVNGGRVGAFGGSRSINVNVNSTLEFDGETLARKQYSYNQAEDARRGPAAVK